MLKTVTLTAFIASLFVPEASFADAPAGVAGSVYEAETRRPLAGIAVTVERQGGQERVLNLVTNRQGFFTELGLEPGRYTVTTSAEGRAPTCNVADIAAGQTRRFHIVLTSGDAGAGCDTSRAGSLVDPDDTADVYRIH